MPGHGGHPPTRSRPAAPHDRPAPVPRRDGRRRRPVLHLGDYIYENPPRRNLPRRHAGGEPIDLAGYRVRHALYKTDPDLQAHARPPSLRHHLGRHEVENDYAGRHPVEGGDPAAFLRRRAAAYRAAWEHLPAAARP